MLKWRKLKPSKVRLLNGWPLARSHRVAATAAMSLLLAALTPAQTQNAIANGETRTINLYHTHSGESIQATFRVNGQYDSAVLEKLNYFLRDWRNDETIKMDPRLFDVVWETYRESGSQEPIHVVSAYRSPQTNAMLRRRSKAVAEFSQHMLGKAMDMHYMDVPMSRVREIAMRLQRGGVGYYPTAGTPFVHLDVGNVRAWPRMTYDQLARLFPDGKTVHLPPDGHPLARYDEARAEIETRNGAVLPSMAQVQSKGFFATLFGGDEDESVSAEPPRGPRSRVATYIENRNKPKFPSAEDESGAGGYFVAEANRSPVVEQAERNLPRGETYLAPAPAAPAVLASASVPLPPSRPAEATAELALQMAAAGARPSDPPLPPRRPSDMPFGQLAAVNAPLPPTRPAELRQPEMRVAELRISEQRLADPRPEPTRIARPAELPGVILGSSAPAVAPPPAALAYAAPPATPAPVQRPIAGGPRSTARAPAARPDLVASTLDRMTLAALIKTASVSSLTNPAANAAKPAPGASRAEITRAIFAPPTQVANGFNKSAGSLSTTAFSGRAVAPVGRDGGTQVMALAKRPD